MKKWITFFISVPLLFSFMIMLAFSDYIGIGLSSPPFGHDHRFHEAMGFGSHSGIGEEVQGPDDIMLPAGLQLCYGQRYFDKLTGEINLFIFPVGELISPSQYCILTGGFKFDLRSIDNYIWSPWVSIDFAFHLHNPLIFWVSGYGFGLSPALGIDLNVGKRVILCGAYRAHYANLKFYNYGEFNAFSHTFTANLLLRLGKRGRYTSL